MYNVTYKYVTTYLCGNIIKTHEQRVNKNVSEKRELHEIMKTYIQDLILWEKTEEFRNLGTLV